VEKQKRDVKDKIILFCTYTPTISEPRKETKGTWGVVTGALWVGISGPEAMRGRGGKLFKGERV